MLASKRDTGTDGGRRKAGTSSPVWWQRTYQRAWRIVSYRWAIIWHKSGGEAGSKQARTTTFAQVVHDAVRCEELRLIRELKRLGIDPRRVKQVKATPRRPIPPFYTDAEMAEQPAAPAADRYEVDPPGME